MGFVLIAGFALGSLTIAVCFAFGTTARTISRPAPTPAEYRGRAYHPAGQHGAPPPDYRCPSCSEPELISSPASSGDTVTVVALCPTCSDALDRFDGGSL